MTQQNLNNEHEKAVTHGMRLSDNAQVLTLIPTFLWVVLLLASSPFVIDGTLRGGSQVLFGVIVTTIAVFIAIPAMKAWRAVKAFKQANPQAYKDGQRYIGQASYVDKMVFNQNSEINKRLYGR